MKRDKNKYTHTHIFLKSDPQKKTTPKTPHQKTSAHPKNNKTQTYFHYILFHSAVFYVLIIGCMILEVLRAIINCIVFVETSEGSSRYRWR